MELPTNLPFTLEILPSDIVGVLVSLSPKVYWRVATLSKSFNRRVRVGLPPMRAKRLFLRKKVKTDRGRTMTFYKLPNGNINGVVAKTIEMVGDMEYWGIDEDYMRPVEIYPMDGPAGDLPPVDLLTTSELTAQQLEDGMANINDDIGAQLYTNGAHDLPMPYCWPRLRKSSTKTTLSMDDFVINNEVIYGVSVNDYSKMITRPRKEIVYALNGAQIYRKNERPPPNAPKYVIDNVMMVCQDVSVMFTYTGNSINTSIVYNNKGILLIEHETAFGYSLNVISPSIRRRMYDIDYKTSNIYRIARDDALKLHLCMIFMELADIDLRKRTMAKMELKKLCRENGWRLTDAAKQVHTELADVNWEDELIRGSGVGETYVGDITDGEPMFEPVANGDSETQGLMDQMD